DHSQGRMRHPRQNRFPRVVDELTEPVDVEGIRRADVQDGSVAWYGWTRSPPVVSVGDGDHALFRKFLLDGLAVVRLDRYQYVGSAVRCFLGLRRAHDRDPQAVDLDVLVPIEDFDGVD